MELRFLLRSTQRLKPPRLSHHSQHRPSSNKTSPQQAQPIGDYYASLLTQPLPTPSQPIISKPPTTASPSSANPPISSTPSSESPSTPNTSEPEPSILFSSRLSSPLEHRSEIQKKSKLVAGVWVPPRPEEPDNCCMSGCVNCVWDRYRDELEEWAGARKEADRALRRDKLLEKGKRRRKGIELQGTGLMRGDVEEGAEHTAVSMDDDGGGSEALWGNGVLDGDVLSEELFRGVPVGIREFMKQEKRLKEKHLREGTSGGERCYIYPFRQYVKSHGHRC